MKFELVSFHSSDNEKRIHNEKKARIALISHDGKKPEMIAFAVKNRDFLTQCNLFATGTTGLHIEKKGFSVHKLLSGPKGGDAQIGAMVTTGKIDMVIFFKDPMGSHPHEADIQMLTRLCDVHNVPLVSNPMGAKYLLKGFSEENSRISTYISNSIRFAQA